MKKHLDNMKRLYAKLQARYGDSDDLVSKLKFELAFLEAAETGQTLDSKRYAMLHHHRRKQDAGAVAMPLQ